MKHLFTTALVLLSSIAMADTIEVDVEKITTKVVCYGTYDCGYWGGEMECEGTGSSQMFFDLATYKKLQNLPENQSYATTKSCRDINDVDQVESGTVPANLQEVIKSKGTEIDVIIYPNKGYFLENM